VSAAEPLVLTVTPAEGATDFSVRIEADTVVGSGPEAGVRLDATGVASLHARIERQRGRWRILRLAAEADIFLNGELVAEAFLRTGDHLRLGDACLRIERPGGVASRRAFLVRADGRPVLQPPPAPAAAERSSPLPPPLPHPTPGPTPTPAPLVPEDASSYAVRLDQIDRDATVAFKRAEPGADPFTLERRLSTLWRCVTALRRVDRRDRLLQRVLFLVTDVLSPDRAFILLPDPGAPGHFLRALGAGPRADLGAAPSHSIVARAIEERAVVLVRDARHDERFALAGSVVSQGIATAVCVPLYCRDEAAAVLYADRLGGAPFDASSLCLAGLIATQAGAELDNIALLEELERVNGDLERKVQERSAEVRRKEGEIRAIAAEQDEVVSIVNHDLRGPLAALLGFLELARGDVEELRPATSLRRGGGPAGAGAGAAGGGALPPAGAAPAWVGTSGPFDLLRGHIARAADASRELQLLFDGVVAVKRLESGKLTLAPDRAAVDDLVARARDAVPRAGAGRGVRVEVDAPSGLHVLADPRRVGQALALLVLHATKVSPPDGRVLIAISPEGPDAVRISVADEGPRPAAEELPGLLGRFQRRPEGQVAKGKGLGLAIAHRLVEMHGAGLEVGWVPGLGSRYSFVLPAAR